MYVYTFKCGRCKHVWHKTVSGPGAGGMGGKCPQCGSGNVRTIGEERVKR